MPSWSTHFAVANEICKRINIEKNEFIFANIMPDILGGYQIEKISKKSDYDLTHYATIISINGINIPIPDIDKFKRMYINKLDNPVICGYFSHLLLDYFWNTYTYENYYENVNTKENLVKVKLKSGETKILEWDDSVRIKQKDFKIFTNYIENTKAFEKPIYSKDIVEYSKEIEEIRYTDLDIQNTANFILNMKNDKNMKEEYQLFEQKELEQKLEESVEFIISNLNKK